MNCDRGAIIERTDERSNLVIYDINGLLDILSRFLRLPSCLKNVAHLLLHCYALGVIIKLEVGTFLYNIIWG